MSNKEVYTYRRDYFGDHVIYEHYRFIASDGFFTKWRKFYNAFLYKKSY